MVKKKIWIGALMKVNIKMKEKSLNEKIVYQAFNESHKIRKLEKDCLTFPVSRSDRTDLQLFQVINIVFFI